MNNLNNQGGQAQELDILGDLNNLDSIMFHHQNVGNCDNTSPANIFALEPDMMYMPEVTATEGFHGLTENNTFSLQPEQCQDELFEDMIANTNPHTFEENLYINPMRMKSKGIRPALPQRAVSEAGFSDIDKLDKDYDMLSDFSEELDRQAMFSFIRLGQTDTLETGGLSSNIFQQQKLGQNIFACRSENLFDDEDSQEEVENQQSPFEVEYEQCNDCGAEGDIDKDIGLDSTMSFSIKDGEFRRHQNDHEISSNHQDRPLSQHNATQRQISGKKIRTAFSQYNMKDMDQDQEDYDQEIDNIDYNKNDINNDCLKYDLLMQGNDLDLVMKGRQRSMMVNTSSPRKQSCQVKRSEALLTPGRISVDDQSQNQVSQFNLQGYNTRSIFDPSLFTYYMNQYQMPLTQQPAQAQMINPQPLELEQIQKSGDVTVQKTKNKKNKEEKNRNIEKLNKAKRTQGFKASKVQQKKVSKLRTPKVQKKEIQDKVSPTTQEETDEEQIKMPLMTFDNQMPQPEVKQEIVPKSVEMVVEKWTTSVDKVQPKKEAKVTKIGQAAAKSEKYYKQFDFFFNRSCFRIMTEFYKDKFNKFYDLKQAALKKSNLAMWQEQQKKGGLTSISKIEMDIMMLQFIEHIFGSDILRLTQQITKIERQQVINSMMMIVFSHRYSKGDVFILEAEKDAPVGKPVIDFAIIRDVMYKYSKKAQDRYFSFPIEAFLFAAFSLSEEGLHFLKNKPDNHGDTDKLQRLQNDLVELKKQAVNTLQNQSKFMDQSDHPDQNGQTVKLGIYLFNELKKMTRGKI